jgi:hypothetical protein
MLVIIFSRLPSIVPEDGVVASNVIRMGRSHGHLILPFHLGPAGPFPFYIYSLQSLPHYPSLLTTHMPITA